MGEIRRLTKFATQYETEFAQIVMGHSIKAAEQEQRMKQKELNSLIARDKELDTLFEKIYEDNVSGKISDERFSKLSVKYDTEQKEFNIRVKELEDELAKKQNKSVSADMFITSVRKYTRARKLTTKMLNELIEKIEVYQAEEIDGKRIQRLKIHYNCIGSIEIPNIDKLPENNVYVHTRQGVDIHYAACAGKSLYKEPTIPEEVAKYQPPVDLDEILKDVDLNKLKEIFDTVIKRQIDKIDPVRSKFGKIEMEEVSLTDKITYVKKVAVKKHKCSFKQLLENQTSKMEVIVTFLAVLELIKVGEINVSQEKTFDDIIISTKE